MSRLKLDTKSDSRSKGRNASAQKVSKICHGARLISSGFTKQTLTLQTAKNIDHLVGRVDTHFDQVPDSLGGVESFCDGVWCLEADLKEAE